MIDAVRRKQTLASFDYQWAELPEGDAMLSDPWFVENVQRVLAEQLLGVSPEWFAGRTVLDAGCGAGRWTLGLLRLGCRVLAVDYSPRGVEATRAQMERLAPDAVRQGRLETAQVDLLAPPADLLQRRFDLVFAFGVLHYTGDARTALANLAPLVTDDGMMFLYLYGQRSVSFRNQALLTLARFGLAPFPFAAKKAILRVLLPGRDTHQAFNLFSPLIDNRYDLETVRGWLREEGLPRVTQTLEHTELFLRAAREACTAPLLAPPARPYWFERYRKPS